MHSFYSKASNIFAVTSYIMCASFPTPFLWLFYRRWGNWYLFIWSCALGLKEFNTLSSMHRMLIEVLTRNSMRLFISSERQYWGSQCFEYLLTFIKLATSDSMLLNWSLPLHFPCLSKFYVYPIKTNSLVPRQLLQYLVNF